jgi:hypothetical protein
MKHPLDFTLVAMTLWLLASMIIDALTPKWLTVYVVGAALIPWFVVGILLRLPNLSRRNTSSRARRRGP